MTDLLPCPFCGGEAEMCHVTQLWEPRNSYWAKCKKCHISGTQHNTESEAIAAWNTRTERTCHADLNAGRNAVVCSECGSSMLLEGWEEMKDWGGNVLINTFKTYPYCPNCGSKVVEQ